MKHSLACLFFIALAAFPVAAQNPEKPAEKKQFVYVLRLVPRLIDEKNWTENDNKIVDTHFKQLQTLQKEGKLVLAGKTTVVNPVGIVILQVDSEEEARRIMLSDEAVKEKIMTAQLYPFKIALMKKSE